MSNDQLPAEVQERIKADAIRMYPLTASHTHTDGPRTGYIAGATETTTRAQVLVDALVSIKNKLNWIENAEELDIIREALQQWKGKEVENG